MLGLCAILFSFLTALLILVVFLRYQKYDPFFFFMHTHLPNSISSPIPHPMVLQFYVLGMLLFNCFNQALNPLHGQTPTIYCWYWVGYIMENKKEMPLCAQNFATYIIVDKIVTTLLLYCRGEWMYAIIYNFQLIFLELLRHITFCAISSLFLF